MLFEMIGTQAIQLEGGRVIEPDAGRFEASADEMPSYMADWFQKINAIRVVSVAPVVAEEHDAEEPDRPMLRRRRPALAEEE
jgi:hypothetical protein